MTPAEKFADLHLHTFYSDGTDSPASLVTRAHHLGLACIALTDHDTLDGIEQTRAAAEQAGLEFIVGVEITAHSGETELHILGYLVDASHTGLAQLLARSRESRRERVEQICSRLQELGLPLSSDAVFALAGVGSCGRPHVARALREAGMVASVQEAFHRFLGRGKPAFVPKWKPTVAEAIAAIHDAHGVAVLAHPALANMDDRMETLRHMGIRGLEVWHSSHNRDAVARYKKLAEDLGLLITGGSDCHGLTKDAPTMGTVKLPYKYVQALKAARANP